MNASVVFSPPLPANEDLRAISEAWPALSKPVKAGILAMVNAAACAEKQR